MSWTAGTFSVPARVNADDDPTTSGRIGNGSRVVRLTVTNLSDGTAVETFAQPLEIVFVAGLAGSALVLPGRHHLVARAGALLERAAARVSPTATSSTRRERCICSRVT